MERRAREGSAGEDKEEEGEEKEEKHKEEEEEEGDEEEEEENEEGGGRMRRKKGKERARRNGPYISKDIPRARRMCKPQAMVGAARAEHIWMPSQPRPY